jgi:3-oxoacyl-[acyl-carrier protein] reductase
MQHHVITGAASGIGFELARILLERGDSVLACDIQLASMDRLRPHAAAPERLEIMQLDVRDPLQWDTALQTAARLWPRIDTVMNVAGVMHLGFIAEIGPADVDSHLDINTKGTIYGTQAAFRAMRNQAEAGRLGRGHIVNIASLAGLSPVPGASLYSASKFAVRGYSLSVLHELRKHGIALTVVCPDAAATPMLMPFAHQPQAALIFTGFRLLQAEDVARAIVNRALKTRPAEFTLPRHRGLLAKLAGNWPALASLLLDGMTRVGLRRQARLP